MRFLNPKTDFAFKKIFGSDQSKDILLSFLNAMLTLPPTQQIIEVTILDPYQAPKILGMKDTFVDVRATDETGRQFIIEMQVLNVQGFEQRVLYNACKNYAGQLSASERYTDLSDVIALTITDFVMFPERQTFNTSFKLRADDGELYSEDLALVFVELPKFNKTLEALSDIQDRWLYFLKQAPSLEMIPESFKSDQSLVHAFDIANRAGLSPEEEEAQDKREIFIRDQRGALSKAIAEGLEKGRTEGRAEGEAIGLERGEAIGIEKGVAIGVEKGVAIGVEKGVAIGVEQGKRDIALNLLTLGLSTEQIIAATGLTAEAIANLRNP
jgi:predicted transposase/invertase (TIGR01784 family)